MELEPTELVAYIWDGGLFLNKKLNIKKERFL